MKKNISVTVDIDAHKILVEQGVNVSKLVNDAILKEAYRTRPSDILEEITEEEKNKREQIEKAAHQQKVARFRAWEEGRIAERDRLYDAGQVEEALYVMREIRFKRKEAGLS